MNQVRDGGALLKTLRSAARIRAAELLISARYPERKMRCPTHLGLGQEIVPAAFGVLARPEDRFLGTYRAHGHYLAKGGDMTRLFAELLGKPGGCSGGFGGSPHLIAREVNFHGTSAIVGGMAPIAVGVAWKLKRSGGPGVTVVFVGDGALEEGVVTESVNFAALHRLPLLMVCENNRLAVTTPPELRVPNEDLRTRFASYGVPGTRVSALDPEALVAAAAAALADVRAGEGPRYLEVMVSRWATHVGHEWSGPAEGWHGSPEGAAGACPLAAAAAALLGTGAIDRAGLEAIARDASAEAEAAYARAEALPDHSPEASVESLVYASGALSAMPDGSGADSRRSNAPAEHDRLVNPY